MPILTLIVGALAAGATASLKKVGGDVVQTIYDRLKAAVIARTQRKAAVEALAEDPSSAAGRQVVEEALQKSGAEADTDLARIAAELNEALAKLQPHEQAAIGVDVAQLEAVNVTLRNITASGTGVKGEHWKLSGDLNIDGVNAGGGAGKN
ncbi:MAG: hypothetical protein JF607_19615 [Burkholderiales bacterium]|jgi:hypothetical protein|nr:hypothetical protein [Burkholderiales bacterium]